MSTDLPNKYQPEPRLIDDPAQLRQLYHEQGCTIREIAQQHATVGSTRVYEALNEYDIMDESATSMKQSERGCDPPSLNWSNVA
jgi:hypothetical protein